MAKSGVAIIFRAMRQEYTSFESGHTCQGAIPMSYITQGTIQVECVTKTKGKVSIVISPSNDYAVKHKKKDYVVFISEGDLKSLVFEKETPFEVTNNRAIDILIHAAVSQIVVEVEVNEKAKPDGKTEIVAVRVPGSRGSDGK